MATSAAAASFLVRNTAACAASLCAPTRSIFQLSRRSMGHTVRIILTDDLPDGKGYSGDIKVVKAGYARNYLIPKKKALYAIPANFKRLGMEDPDLETIEQRRAREAREAAQADEEGAKDSKAADFLRHYLRNKVLKIWRHADPTTGVVAPGKVNYMNVRDKLSRQLKIDLEDHEMVHLRAQPVVHAGLDDERIEEMLSKIGTKSDEGEARESVNVEECQVEIRQLGEYLAKISLRGGHSVPLKFVVLKR